MDFTYMAMPNQKCFDVIYLCKLTKELSHNLFKHQFQCKICIVKCKDMLSHATPAFWCAYSLFLSLSHNPLITDI